MPLQPLGQEQLEDRIVVGGTASGNAIAAALGAGAGLLRIFTHSDGVCAYLGSRVLCPLLKRWPAHQDGRRRPACVGRSRCHRLHMPLGQALADERLLSPDSVSGRIVMLGTCYGFLPASAIIEPVWGHTDALLSLGRVGAVVATWGLSFGDDHDFDPLAEDIDAGLPVGTALARFSRRATARSGRIRQCLLGDPRVRLPNEGHAAQDAPILPAAPAAAESIGGDFLAWLLLLGETALRTPAHRAELAQARRAAGDLGNSLLSHGQRMHILRAIARLGSMPSKLWLSLGCDLRKQHGPAVACGTCHQSVWVFDGHVPVAGPADRQLIVCPNCGILEDSPADRSSLRLTLRTTALDLIGSMHGPWSAGARIESFGKEHVRWKDWGANNAEDGRFRPLDIADSLPPTHGFASVFLLSSRREIRVLTVPFVH
jgi:hypothetical protein